MISDDRAEKAVEFLRDNAPKIAQAKANMIYLESYAKVIKAKTVLEAQGTVQERDALSYTSPEFLTNLDGLREATEAYEDLRWRMTAAEATLEAWRTMSANQRRNSV